MSESSRTGAGTIPISLNPAGGATFSRAWKLAADVVVSHISIGPDAGLVTQI
jgi:hypothetical protein